MPLGQIQLIALEVKDLSSDMKSTQCAVYGIMVPCFFLWYKIHCHIYNVHKKCIRFLSTEMTALSSLPHLQKYRIVCLFSRDHFVFVRAANLLTFCLGHFNLFKLCAHIYMAVIISDF